MHLGFVKYNKGPQSFTDEARRTTWNSVLPWAEITQKGHDKFLFGLSIEVCFLPHPTPKQRHRRYIWKYPRYPVFIKELWPLWKPKSLDFSVLALPPFLHPSLPSSLPLGLSFVSDCIFYFLPTPFGFASSVDVCYQDAYKTHSCVWKGESWGLWDRDLGEPGWPLVIFSLST